MSLSSAFRRLIHALPDGRLKNYLETMQRNNRRGNSFRIRFNIWKNYWTIRYDGCDFRFTKDPYDRFRRDINMARKMPSWQPEVIIDAHPGQGTTGILLAHHHPGAMVYMFEPEEADYQIMMENIYHNNLSNTVVVPRRDAALYNFLLNDIAGHFFDKSIILKLHLPACSQEMISVIAGIWRYNHLRVILTTEDTDTLSYSYDNLGEICSEQGLPFILNRHDHHMPVFINERNLLG